MRCKICDTSGIRTNNSKFKKHHLMCEDCLRVSGLYGLADDLPNMPRYNTKYMDELLRSGSDLGVEI